MIIWWLDLKTPFSKKTPKKQNKTKNRTHRCTCRNLKNKSKNIFNHFNTVKYFFFFYNRIIVQIFVEDIFEIGRLLRFPYFRKLCVKFIQRTESYFCCYSFQKLQAKRSQGRLTLYSQTAENTKSNLNLDSYI